MYSITQAVLMGFAGFTFVVYTRFLHFNERRSNLVVLDDPMFLHIQAVNCDLLLTLLSVLTHARFLYYLTSLYHEQCFILTFTLCMWTRMCTIYLCPLTLPPNAIPASDALVNLFMPGGRTHRNDLFFSGHSIQQCIFYHCSDQDPFYLLTFALTALLLLLSKTHYTIDIFVTPFLAFSLHRMAALCLDAFHACLTSPRSILT